MDRRNCRGNNRRCSMDAVGNKKRAADFVRDRQSEKNRYTKQHHRHGNHRTRNIGHGRHTGIGNCQQTVR